GEALVARAERLITERGYDGFAESSIEVVGAEEATEAVLKVGVRHAAREALEIFAGEYAPMALVAQGMAGTFAGRPRPAPVIRVYHLLADKKRVPARVTLDDRVLDVAISPGSPDAETVTPPLAEPAAPRVADGTTVPLHRLAYGRSGDKGNLANIGLIARRPEFASILREQVTAERVTALFRKYLQDGGVTRWELPGISAINIVLPEVLGGTGGTSTLRYDPQGKSYAAMLLTLPVTVPSEWEHDLRLAAPEVAP
ncbi:MAG: AtuA-related protein, partial [Thermoleophilaceae bacterium]